MRTGKMLKSLKIGNVVLKNNLLLAPMAGYGDIAFRRLCRDYGAGLTTTEMISAKGLVYKNGKTEEMLRLAPNETPSCVQLFGSDEGAFAESVQSPALKSFDIIDINMGCPVKKITSNGEGSALMKDFKKAAAVIRACVKATDRPVSVKFRLGYGENDRFSEEFAKMCEAEGAAMLSVHGRTAAQMYGGKADWEQIERTARSVKIPVIGNGDITSCTDIYFRLRDTALAGLMIGRGALGHPDIFAEAQGLERDILCDVILRHIDYMDEYFEPHYTAVNIRKHLACYLKGIPDTKELRGKVNEIADSAQLKAEIIKTLKKDN